jgi:dTDP-4-amino-4,6-dideoxygalactose transaminase
MIPFNKPYITGNELRYIQEAIYNGHLSGNGPFTKRCQVLLRERYGFRHVLLTSSGTDALEMCAILADIKEGDEVIMPSYTFVSTANAFVLRGACVVFADSERDTPNIDANLIEGLITPRTRAIVVVHYAGVACDMDAIMGIANRHGLIVIEDCAHAIDSYYRGTVLGSIGKLSAFSFHETKNVISGEGGMIVVNDKGLIERAEIIWEKGTNRTAFYRGEVDKYGWVDVGSSFLPSDITAAFLYAQLEAIEQIQERRRKIWEVYYKRLRPLEEKGFIRLPFIPEYAVNNGHLFYIICRSLEEREALRLYLNEEGINAVFHYQCLHKSQFYRHRHNNGRQLPMAEHYEQSLLRLPFHCYLTEDDIERVVETIARWYPP